MSKLRMTLFSVGFVIALALVVFAWRTRSEPQSPFCEDSGGSKAPVGAVRRTPDDAAPELCTEHGWVR